MSSPALDLVGAVLAGGRSRRLGRDKSREVIGDRRMIDRAVSALRPLCRDVFVVSSRPDTPEGPWVRIPDRVAGGPLAGIEAALDHGKALGADAVFVLACDLPLVGPELLTALRDGLGPADAAAPERSGHPDVEPLCALYRVECLPEARTLLAGEDRAAHRLFDAVRGVRIQVDAHGLLNVNTEGDLSRARSAVVGEEDRA